MGLDLVEIIMDVEERFCINIPDKDAYHLSTPRKLMDYIAQKLELNPQNAETCETQIAFYKIRKILITQFNHTKSTIKPSLPIKALLPPTYPNQYLKKLLHSIGVNGGPQLVFSDAFERKIMYPFVFIFLIAFILLTNFYGPANGMIVALLLSWLPVQLIFAFSDHKRTELMPSNYTIGDLAYLLVAKKGEVKNENLNWTKAKIDQNVKAIIMNVLGIGAFDEHADFINDLGAD